MTEKNMSSATEVFLTGCSAGGLATFYWTNYVRSILPKTTFMAAAPDSGLFLDFPNYGYGEGERLYRQQFINFMKLSVII